MTIQTLELNDIVCVETYAGGRTLVHFKGGRYIETAGDDAITLQKILADRLQKIMAVYGEPPKQEPTTY